MPEGHTIHRLADAHRRLFAGSGVAVSSPQGRFAEGAARLDGNVLEDVEAWGKNLFYRFEGARYLHVHLGLVGKMLRHDAPGPAPRSSVRVRLENAEGSVDLIGPMTCEIIDAGERDVVLDRLGPDPLRHDGDPAEVWTALRRRRIPIGRALLDQAIVAGIGNVYRAEVLFATGTDPERPSRDVSRDNFDRIWERVSTWMRRGVDAGRIVTVPPSVSQRTGRATYVYKQDDCLECGADIRSWRLGGRLVYGCPTCQALP